MDCARGIAAVHTVQRLKMQCINMKQRWQMKDVSEPGCHWPVVEIQERGRAAALQDAKTIDAMHSAPQQRSVLRSVDGSKAGSPFVARQTLHSWQGWYGPSLEGPGRGRGGAHSN